jgi:tRNA A-37 threonylcarbamoyl transferase component Bud32
MNTSLFQFYKDEIFNIEKEKVKIYLSKIYKHLLKNSENQQSGIKKNTLFYYLDISKIICERLFKIFNKSKSGILSKMEFIEGLLSLYFPQEGELEEIVFEILNFGESHFIDREDVIFLISFITNDSNKNDIECIIQNTFKEREKLSYESFKMHDRDIVFLIYSYLLENIPSLKHVPLYYYKYKQKGIGSANLTLKKEKTLSKMEEILDSSPSEKSISLFGKIKRNRTLKKETTINEEKTNDDSDMELKFLEESISIDLPEVLTSQLVKTKDEHRRGLNKYHTEELKTNNDFWQLKNYFFNEFLDDYEGFIYKFTRDESMKRFYVRLYCKDLFVFKDDDSRDVIKSTYNLTNSFIENGFEKTVDGIKYYSFQINLVYKKINLYLRNTQEKDKWIKQISNNIGFKFITTEYYIKENIGHGYFSVVRLGEHKMTRQKVAIKVIKKKNLSERSKEFIKEEAEILRICDHPNIIKFLDFSEDKDNIFLILEYIKGGSLKDFYVNNYERFVCESFVTKILLEIARGILYLHSLNIIHRDIKPDNLLICEKDDSVNIKIIDFGLSKIKPNSLKTNIIVGTLCYTAPEVLKKMTYNNKVDIWSFGVIAYFLLSGSFPYEINNDKVEFVENLVFTEHVWRKRSQEIKKIIKSCLVFNFEKRISIDELVRSLDKLVDE